MISVTPGGGLGGEMETFNSIMHLTLNGTGSLAGFSRNIDIPISSMTLSAPRTPGVFPQTFVREYNSLMGSIIGDPDFAELTIIAGAGVIPALPMPLPPSLGSTTITDLGGGQLDVATFFDLTYQIDFVGAPGGALDMMSGSIVAPVQIGTSSAVLPVELLKFEIE